MNWKNTAIVSLIIAAAAIGWGAAQGGVRGGLKPQDYVDIQELYATYARAFDSDEAEGRVLAETFTPDGTVTLRGRTYAGTKELMGFSHDRDRSGGFIQHWNANLIVRPTPGGANASVYLILFRGPSEDKKAAIETISNYNDVLVKTPNGWRFKTRVIGGPVPAIDP